jgi:hypothetical protein
LGKKYSIQRGHIVEVVQLEPGQASVLELELELVLSQGQAQGLGWVLEPTMGPVPSQGLELELERGQVLE